MDYYRLVFNEDGALKSVSKFTDHEPVPVPLGYITTDVALGQADPRGLRGTIVDGQVVGVEVDPAWQPPAPPAPPADDTAQRLASLEAVVAQNLLASPHDRRWLAQKEAAKGVMGWMQANPECTAQEVEAQIEAAAQAATPGQPVVIAPAGLVRSYADEAARRGYIPGADFGNLKGLVLASSPEQLRLMLAVL